MKRKDSGFTLIEAVVVLILIGVVSAIAAPQVSRYMNRVNNIEARETARTFIGEVEVKAINRFKYPVSAESYKELWGRNVRPDQVSARIFVIEEGPSRGAVLYTRAERTGKTFVSWTFNDGGWEDLGVLDLPAAPPSPGLHGTPNDAQLNWDSATGVSLTQ